jgi:TRAP-type mannitol/chloroaromatic compound transport system substrate-binding protein
MRVPRDEDGPSLMDHQLAFTKSDNGASLVNEHDLVGKYPGRWCLLLPGLHEPGTGLEFGFNRKAYEVLPSDLQRTLDHAAAAVEVYGLSEHHAKNAIVLARLKTEFKGKVEILQYPTALLRDLKKLAAEVVKEESEKSPMARKVYASFTKFQALLSPWDRVAEGAYHQLVAG